MENRLFLSVSNYGYSWLLRPGVLFLLALTLIGVLYPVIQAARQKRKGVR